ncbi:hypothetical protein DPEC_G00293730 [Dallia pectoralis]|uniref:Uncharacterized protein n=1 Tax=Dallia pectoralis TaxID=75939 RepID=A0ACC2FIH5_DALPE|nr:hypothetical protein DPEC_G00293730 [Dallia pectoralis]
MSASREKPKKCQSREIRVLGQNGKELDEDLDWEVERPLATKPHCEFAKEKTVSAPLVATGDTRHCLLALTADEQRIVAPLGLSSYLNNVSITLSSLPEGLGGTLTNWPDFSP